MANSLRYVSWNCKAVNNPVKRSRVLNHLKSLRADFVFLQETHLRSVDHFRLKGIGLDRFSIQYFTLNLEVVQS